MNTNDIAVEYRLSHWAGIMREREESGLSIKQFCKNAGFHENRYFYWQKRLRAAACEELAKMHGNTASMVPVGFTEVKMTSRPALPPTDATYQSRVCIETAGVRITADSEYPVVKLAELMREVARSC
jgi:hypothetical protein